MPQREGIMETKIALFRDKGIRKMLHKDEWWFVIDDVVAFLTDSIDPPGYINDMLRHDKKLSKGWGQIVTPLWLETEGGNRFINARVPSTFCRTSPAAFSRRLFPCGTAYPR